MIDPALVKELVNNKLTETKNFLVDINISASNKIVIEIDSENGISITDCLLISRHVENSLDREKEDFELEVTSPGLDKPFKIFRQYLKNIGRKVASTLLSGEKVEGKLVAADEVNKTISIEFEKKWKEGKKNFKQIVIETIELSNIKETKVVISFK